MHCHSGESRSSLFLHAVKAFFPWRVPYHYLVPIHKNTSDMFINFNERLIMPRNENISIRVNLWCGN